MKRLGDFLHAYGPGIIAGLMLLLLALLTASGRKKRVTTKADRE